MVHIHTGIFQGKDQNFAGFENPPIQNSYPTVQYSVGPMIRSYSRYGPILRTFFITEFRRALASFLTCHEMSQNFPGKTFQGNLSRENFPGTTFQGEGKTQKRLTESVRWRSRMRRGSLPLASTRSARGAEPPGTAGILRNQVVFFGIFCVGTERGMEESPNLRH